MIRVATTPGRRYDRACDPPANPMTGPHRTRRSLPAGACVCALVGLAVCMLALCLWPTTGRADEYGELTRFGEGAPGAKPGKINDEGQRFLGADAMRQILLGVDPEQSGPGGVDAKNSVYLLDEPEPWSESKSRWEVPTEEPAKVEFEEELVGIGEECKERSPFKQALEECLESELPYNWEGPVTRDFRLQKFAENSAHEYKAVASASFHEQSPAPLGERLAVEGIAVDPREHRLYVLAVDHREDGLGVDEIAEENVENTNSEPVAARLFAFSTEEAVVKGQKEAALVPAVNGNPELAGPEQLAAQSTEPGKALLEPTGITVDPETGDIIILAHEDPSTAREDQLYDHNGKPSQDHFVLQRITPEGKVVPENEGGRWVDTDNIFKTEELSRGQESTPPTLRSSSGPRARRKWTWSTKEGSTASRPISPKTKRQSPATAQDRKK